MVFQGRLHADWRPHFKASHLSYTSRLNVQCQAIVKVHGVFPSCRGYTASSQRVQFHCLYVHGFRFFFTPLAGVLFAFPSRYWFTIGQSGVFSLGGWSPHIQTGYHVSRPTHRAHSMCIFVYGAVTLYRAPFQTLPLTHTLIQALGCSPFARRYWGNLG